MVHTQYFYFGLSVEFFWLNRTMSLILGKLNSILLREHFGVNAQIVGDCLFSAVQSRPLSTIVKATGLTKNEVSHALASLIRFRLVKFVPGASQNVVEYSIKADKVYLLVREADQTIGSVCSGHL